MIVNIVLFFITVLAFFPFGRVVIGLVFNAVIGTLGSYENNNSINSNDGRDGNHYDHFTGEVHAYKEVGGMYDD